MTWNCQALLRLRHLLGLWCYWNWRILLLLTPFRAEIFLKSLIISPHNMRYTHISLFVIKNCKIMKYSSSTANEDAVISNAQEPPGFLRIPAMFLRLWFMSLTEQVRDSSREAMQCMPKPVTVLWPGAKPTTSVSVSSPDLLTEKKQLLHFICLLLSSSNSYAKCLFFHVYIKALSTWKKTLKNQFWLLLTPACASVPGLL